jgi:HEPN domain-containing protein
MNNGDNLKIIKYWKGHSDYDIVTAKYMLETKRYPYCLFLCHLSIEKIIKAIIVLQTKKSAPYSHNLVDLAKKTKIDFSTNQQEILADLTEFNLEARYPEWKKDFYKKASRAYTQKYYQETIKLQKWLKNYLKK